MSSPKAPSPMPGVVPLAASNDVKQVFVTELTGSQVIAGNLHMAFSVLNPKFTSSAPNVTSLTMTRQPAVSLVMPLAAIPDVAEQLRQILTSVSVDKNGPGLPKGN